jgi:hypothetical protein
LIASPASTLVSLIWENDDCSAGAVGVLVVFDGGSEGLCGKCLPCRSAEQDRAQAAKNWVYFIRAGSSGPIKIGRSNNVDGRLSGLQTAHHADLKLILKVPGGAAVESAFHAALSQYRIRGEWFQPDAEVLRFIEELRG